MAEKHEVEEFFRVDKVIVSELVKVTTMEVMATSASAADDTTCRSVLHSIRIAPFMSGCCRLSGFPTR